MKQLLNSRRFVLGLFAIFALAVLGMYCEKTDVALSIATIVVGIAGANAYQGKGKSDV
jgi:hypothetical protein